MSLYTRFCILLFALLLTVPLPFLPEFGGANSSTRLMLTAAIVEEGTTRIDRHAALTVDKAQHEGHFYSDKAPGMALMAVPAYAIGQALTPAGAEALFHFDEAFEAQPRSTMILYRAILFFGAGLLFALAGVALLRMCLRLGMPLPAAGLAVVSVCLATPLLGWSVQFFGHVSAGALLALAFAFAAGFGRNAEPSNLIGQGLRAALTGACLSFAVSVEYTAAPAAVLVALYGLWRLLQIERRQAGKLLALGVIAAVIAALPMLVYHWITFGGPLRVGYSSVVGFEGMEEGFHGLTYPDPVVIWKIVFGFRRGILWLSPLLIFVPLGLWLGLRPIAAGALRIRAEMLLCLAVIIYYLLFNASYYYWSGGASVGPRHILPSVFFMALPLCVVWMEAKERLRLVLRGLLGLSLFFSLASASMTMTVPGGMRFPLKDPILENLFTDQNVFARYTAWSDSAPWIFAIWLLVSLGLAAALWRVSKPKHATH